MIRNLLRETVSVETKFENVRRQLERLLQDLGEIPAEEIPAFLIQLSACQTALAARMSTATTAHDGREPVEDRLLSIPDVSRLLNVRRAYVYDLARRGQLPTVRIGKHLRVHPTDLRKWIDRHREKGLDASMYTVYSHSTSRRGDHDRKRTSARKKTARADTSGPGGAPRRHLDYGGKVGARRSGDPGADGPAGPSRGRGKG